MKYLTKTLFLSFLLSSSAFINNYMFIQKRPQAAIVKSIALRSSLNNSSLIKRNATIYKMDFSKSNNDDFDNDNFILLKLYFYSISTMYLIEFILNYIK